MDERKQISPQKSGTTRSQIAAMLAARRAIDRWCRANPTSCAPLVADPIVLSARPRRPDFARNPCDYADLSKWHNRSASRPLHTVFVMYHHVKKLMYTVRVDEPDPKFGNMLLEQFGGANGELAAAMQYSIQGLNCEDPARKDLLMDIGTEELSHLEVVGTLARLHLKPLKSVREEVAIR